jgi:DnaJ-class molecular chaperone
MGTEIDCPVCDGTGYVECGECDGSGKVDEEDEKQIERYIEAIDTKGGEGD